MPSIGTGAGSTHKRQEEFLELPPSNFPSTVCLALGYNTTASLLTTVYASESLITTSCGLKLVSLTLGGVTSPKFHFVLPSDLVHAHTTIPSREGFWETETWAIRPRPSLRLHSSKSDSCRDDATNPNFGCHTLKERLPKSSLACRGVKKNSIS
jgi:hypothetical protein